MSIAGRFSTSGRFPKGRKTTWEELERRRGSVGYQYSKDSNPSNIPEFSYRENLAKQLASMGHEVPENGPYAIYVRPELTKDELSLLSKSGFPLYPLPPISFVVLLPIAGAPYSKEFELPE